MSSFKILPSDKEKQVLCKGQFSEYPDYNKLKRKIIDSAANKKVKIKEGDNFKLVFCQDPKKNLYIPSELKDGIGDKRSYSCFVEKLSLRGINNETYKFYIEKLKRPFKWKKKENLEILNETLDSSWQNIYDDLISEVGSSKLEESQVEYAKLKGQLKKNEDKINKQIHENIICNNCYKKDFKGKRFVCAECKNYNLCQECEKKYYEKQIHQREHTLIQFNKALDDEKDNIKFNNIIGNKNQEFKNVASSFQTEISVINSGEGDLKDCYILPVRFGDDYLSCNPIVITESVERNLTIKIGLIIKLPKDNKGYFEGYFRMFSPSGLPFGDVLYVKVLNGN